MRHAEHDFLDAQLAGLLDDRLDQRDGALGALEGEPLGAHVLDVQEALEALGLVELREDFLLFVVGQLGGVARALDALLNPRLLVGILDVHELDADLRAIGLLDHRQHLAQRRRLEAERAVGEDLAVEVIGSEAVGRRIELGMVLLAIEAERVKRGDQMAAHAVAADQRLQADAVARRLVDRLGVHRRGRRRRRGRRFARHRLAVETVVLGARLGRAGGHAGRPGGAAHLVKHRGYVLAEPGEEVLPARIHRFWIAQVTGVEILDKIRICAVEERRLFEQLSHGPNTVVNWVCFACLP